ncbi:MAG: hypothetical protein ACQ9IQ_01320 [Nitrospirales bacterium]
MLLGMIHINQADQWLHLWLGSTILTFGTVANRCGDTSFHQPMPTGQTA